jgi:hypothetical protein
VVGIRTGGLPWLPRERERGDNVLIYYSGGTHEKPCIPKLLQGTSIMLTFIDNRISPEKVMLRIWRSRKKRR